MTERLVEALPLLREIVDYWNRMGDSAPLGLHSDLIDLVDQLTPSKKSEAPDE